MFIYTSISRPGVGLSSSRQISSCYTVTDLLRKGMLGSSHVTGLQNDSLPNLLWGPPPPYSSSIPQVDIHDMWLIYQPS